MLGALLNGGLFCDYSDLRSLSSWPDVGTVFSVHSSFGKVFTKRMASAASDAPNLQDSRGRVQFVASPRGPQCEGFFYKAEGVSNRSRIIRADPVRARMRLRTSLFFDSLRADGTESCGHAAETDRNETIRKSFSRVMVKIDQRL